MEEETCPSKKPLKKREAFSISLTEITLQDLASAGVFQPAYGLFLDLAHALARQVEFLSNLLQRHRVAAAQSELHADDILLPLRQGGDGSVDFFAQRLIKKFSLGRRGFFAFQHVVHGVVFILHERCVH